MSSNSGCGFGCPAMEMAAPSYEKEIASIVRAGPAGEGDPRKGRSTGAARSPSIARGGLRSTPAPPFQGPAVGSGRRHRPSSQLSCGNWRCGRAASRPRGNHHPGAGLLPCRSGSHSAGAQGRGGGPDGGPERPPSTGSALQHSSTEAARAGMGRRESAGGRALRACASNPALLERTSRLTHPVSDLAKADAAGGARRPQAPPSSLAAACALSLLQFCR